MATIPSSFDTEQVAVRTQIYLEGVALDLDKSVDVDFTYSIADIADFEKRVTTFSKTVTIKGTAHNNFLFGNYFDFNINNQYSSLQDNIGVNFNPLKKASCQVTVDNVEIFAGVLRLLEIKSIDNEIYYECAMFGSLGGLFTTIGEKLLTDLNLSDLDHAYNLTNIKNSWTAVNPKYVYPLAQYGIGADNVNDSFYDVLNFRPAPVVKELFNKIISEAGYTYNSDFWDDNHLDKLIVLNNEDVFSAYYSELASASFIQVTVNDQSGAVLNFDSTNPNYLVFDTTTGGFKRIKNNTNATIIVEFEYNIDYESNFSILQTVSVVGYVRNDSAIGTIKNIVSTALPVLFPFGGGFSSGNVKATAQFQLEPGDGVNLDLMGGTLIPGFPPSGYFTSFTTSSITVKNSDENKKIPVKYNTNITGKSFVPENIKQADFVKSIINLLNLYIIQNPDNEFNLIFTPYPDFYTDEIVDWSDKFDKSSGYSIKSSNDFLPKTYSFNYKDDNDYYSKTYKNKYNIAYGNLKYETQNDFSKDDISTEFIFSLVPSISNPKHNRIVPAMFDIDTNGSYKQIKTNPKLCFYGGVKASSVNYTIKNGATTLSTESTYAYAGHIWNPSVAQDGTLWDLCFKIPSEVYFSILNYPTNNLFNIYYNSFVQSQNNKDSKLLTLYFLLNSVDIEKIDFRKYIKVNNGLYYLTKIEEYNPLSNDLTKVELIKIV